jgi:hypothetical protein
VNFEQMFLNTVEGLEAGGAKLQHVQFVSGKACSTHISLHKSCLFVMARSATLLSSILCHDASIVCENLQVPNGTALELRPCLVSGLGCSRVPATIVRLVMKQLLPNSLPCSASTLHSLMPLGMGRTWDQSRHPAERMILAACKQFH